MCGGEEEVGGRLGFELGRARPGDLARLRGVASSLAFASAGYRDVVPCDRLPARK